MLKRTWVLNSAVASLIASTLVFFDTAIGSQNVVNSAPASGIDSSVTQCIHFGDQGKGFGSVTDSNWRTWLPDLRFATGEEHLSVAVASGSAALRQKYVPSARGSDRVVVASNLKPHRTYRVTQSVFLEPGWEWGGDTSEGGKLGFGLGGGTNPSGATIDPAGFTARIIWRGNYLGGGKYDGTGRLAIYSYAADRPEKYGEDYFVGDYSVPIGEWFNIVYEIQANSSTNSSDGSARAWINGELLLEKTGIAWQQAGGPPLIDTLYFSSFYGGNNRGWSPSKETYAKFKDVCWAPVVDGYSSINPEIGNHQPETRWVQTSKQLVNDSSEINVAEWVGLAESALQKTEEAVVFINVITPDALEPAPQHYSFALTALHQTMEAVRSVSEKSLSTNPVAWTMVAIEELEIASQLNSVTDIEVEELTGIREVLTQTIENYPALAMKVAEQAQASFGCDDVNLGSPACVASTSTLTEVQALIDGMTNNPSEDIYFIGWQAEQAWNLSVEAINTLEGAELE